MITSERWEDFLAFSLQLRKLQRIYTKTMDPMIRRELRACEQRYDETAVTLAEDLAIFNAREIPRDQVHGQQANIPDQPVTVKGGVE